MAKKVIVKKGKIMKKEVTIKRREAIMRDETEVFGDGIFYDLQWSWLLAD